MPTYPGQARGRQVRTRRCGDRRADAASRRTPTVTPTRSASSSAGTATGCGRSRCAPSATARRPPTPCRTRCCRPSGPVGRAASAATRPSPPGCTGSSSTPASTGYAGARPGPPTRCRSTTSPARGDAVGVAAHRHRRRGGAADPAGRAAQRAGARRHVRLVGRGRRPGARLPERHGEEPVRARPGPAAAVAPATGNPRAGARRPTAERRPSRRRDRQGGEPSSTEHLDADALADLDEGLLDRDHVASARAHVAGCPQCQAELAALTGVRERLAAAAEVGADARGRGRPAWTAALAERRHRARQHRGHPQRHPAAASRSAPRPAACAGCRPPPWSCWSSPAVPWPSRPCAARTTPRHGVQCGRRGRQGRPASRGRRQLPGHRQRSALDQGVGDGRGAAAAGRHARPHPAAEQLRRPGRRERVRGRPPRAGAACRAARLAGGPALADCVTELAGGPATPLAVDLATFDGQPAAVVLLPGIGGPGRVDVWVVRRTAPRGRASSCTTPTWRGPDRRLWGMLSP